MISERTLRRDIERLRDLGYAVESDRGVAGGHRLRGASGDAALLLDDDEAIALAAALHTAACGTSELAEGSLGAPTKVLSIVGPDQRRRAETVRSATVFGHARETASPRLAILDVVASACRDSVRLSFHYVAADGAATARYVEPCQLVALDTRWYLVAYDGDRADWRTFRLDRMSKVAPARNTHTPRSAPADDLYEYVRLNMKNFHAVHQSSSKSICPPTQCETSTGPGMLSKASAASVADSPWMPTRSAGRPTSWPTSTHHSAPSAHQSSSNTCGQ